MSNENKTALTAEELWNEGCVLVRIAPDNTEVDVINRGTFFNLVSRYAESETLQLSEAKKEIQEKDKEIAELKDELRLSRIDTIKYKERFDEKCHTVANLADDLESQQKEIEVLKGNAKEKGKECFEYYKECCNQSKRIKDLDECNRVTINRLLIMKEWLNPVPHTDVEACLNSINHAIQAINELLPKQETSNTQTPNTQPENNFTTCHNCTSDLLCKAQKQCNLINH